MPSHWVTTGSCHLRTTALPFLICRREWRDVPVKHSRPRRVASFQSRLLPLGNEPEQMWTETTRNLPDSLLWSGLPVKKISRRCERAAQGAPITKLGIVGAMILAAAGAAGGGDVWAADIFPIEALSASAASNPKVCTGLWDFITTSCELSWQGITIYGTVDAGGGWQSHGAPLDSRSAPGASYLIEKINRSSQWSLAPNALSTSTIGIKGTEPIGGNLSAVFSVDPGVDPEFLVLSHGAGSHCADVDVPHHPQNRQQECYPADP